MLQSVFIMLREGLEASLIVGIVLAYLARTGNRHKFGSIWLGAGVAVGASLVVAGALFALVGGLEGPAEQIYEGAAMLTAVGVLTYMVFWMRKQAVNIKASLQTRVETALKGGSAVGLGVLAFVVVVREGIETVLFMFASVQASDPLPASLGGVLGLAVAILLGYSIYTGASRLNLHQFFNVTGVLLVFFAGGLLSLGLHEWQEAGLITFGTTAAWNMNSILDETAPVGQILKALFGYNDNPSLLQAFFHAAYLITTLVLYFKPSPKAITTAPSPSRA